MRVGVLGVGKMGQRRLRCLARLGVTDLHAYDPTQTGFDAALHLCAVAHPSLDSLLDVRPKVFFICTPPETHISLAWKAYTVCPQGVFIEKPLALSLNDVDNPTAKTEAWGITTMVGCNWRYSGGFAMLKRELDKLSQVTGATFRATYNLAAVRPDYRTTYAATTGALMDVGWHMVDLALDWFGEAKLTQAEASEVRGLGIPGVDSRGSLTLKHTSGVESQVMVNFGWDEYEVSATIDMPYASLAWQYLGVAPGDDMFLDETRDFLDCVREQKPSINPIAKAKATLSLLLEAKAICQVS